MSAASAPRRRLEMGIFLAVSIAGVFALGQGLRGLFEPGAGIDLGWLAVALAAYWILYAQMCRINQNWPHRPGASRRRTRAGRKPR